MISDDPYVGRRAPPDGPEDLRRRRRRTRPRRAVIVHDDSVEPDGPNVRGRGAPHTEKTDAPASGVTIQPCRPVMQPAVVAADPDVFLGLVPGCREARRHLRTGTGRNAYPHAVQHEAVAFVCPNPRPRRLSAPEPTRSTGCSPRRCVCLPRLAVVHAQEPDVVVDATAQAADLLTAEIPSSDSALPVSFVLQLFPSK